MIDHIELKTRRLEQSAHFYATLLAPLGYALKVDGPGKGFGSGEGLDLFLVDGDPADLVHFAFRAADRALVDEIFALGGAAGFVQDRAPALAPHIHPDYYAGYLRDPDGRLIEFVSHGPA